VFFKVSFSSYLGLSATSCENAIEYGVEDNGFYNINKQLLYCDMKNDGGGWIVIMKRSDGSSSFETKTWDDYRSLFYYQSSSLWAGNDMLNVLTGGKVKYTLLINFVLTNGSKYYALYDEFSVGNPGQQFQLYVTGYSGELCQVRVVTLYAGTKVIPI